MLEALRGGKQSTTGLLVLTGKERKDIKSKGIFLSRTSTAQLQRHRRRHVQAQVRSRAEGIECVAPLVLDLEDGFTGVVLWTRRYRLQTLWSRLGRLNSLGSSTGRASLRVRDTAGNPDVAQLYRLTPKDGRTFKQGFGPASVSRFPLSCFRRVARTKGS